MKKIIYIFPILFAVFFSACEVEGGQSGYPRTLQGKLAYDAVENRFSQSICLLDLMTKINYYAEAPDDQKEGIKNFYLSKYTITHTDRSWILTSTSEEISFTHNQNSINDKGAIWTVKIRTELWNTEYPITVIKDENFMVECLGDKYWKVTTSSLKYLHPFWGYDYSDSNISSAIYIIKGYKAYDKSPNLYDFKVNEGNGSLNWDRTKISYQLVEPAGYSYKSSGYTSLVINSGEIDITVDMDKIQAKVSVPDYDYYSTRVEITLNGITETHY